MAKNTTATDVTKNNYGDTIGTIRINGVPFKHLSTDSVLGFDTLTWSEEPTRNNLFAFENIDQIDIGLVAQCQINLKHCSIEDFIKLREIAKQRYFYVTYYNVDTCQWDYNREMYCSKSEKQKLFYFKPELVGVLDVNITFVATNRDKTDRSPLTISFNNNGYSTISLPTSKSVEYGGVFVVEAPTGTVTGKTFDYWTDSVNTTTHEATGWRYYEGQSFTVWENKILYPIYKTAGV